jgi:hypothetical protein
MMGPQAELSVPDQGFGLIAGHLENGNRQTRQPLIDTAIPGVGVSSIGVLFQQNEVADRLDADQTALWMKRFVLGKGDITRLHLGCQSLIFFLAELDDLVFDFFGCCLLGAVRSSDEVMQIA